MLNVKQSLENSRICEQTLSIMSFLFFVYFLTFTGKPFVGFSRAVAFNKHTWGREVYRAFSASIFLT